jgi:hypothetical protein
MGVDSKINDCSLYLGIMILESGLDGFWGGKRHYFDLKTPLVCYKCHLKMNSERFLTGLLVVLCFLFIAISAWRYWQAGCIDRNPFLYHRNSTVTLTSSFRFYNSGTARKYSLSKEQYAAHGHDLAFRVTSLPEVGFHIGELYAGNIPINTANPSRTFFFVYQPTISTPVDEIVVWLNGGPGLFLV